MKKQLVVEKIEKRKKKFGKQQGKSSNIKNLLLCGPKERWEIDRNI